MGVGPVICEIAMTTWQAVDEAYQAHHATCAHCCAAGAHPGYADRCATGQELWATYNAAGLPPHFTWLHSSPTEQAA